MKGFGSKIPQHLKASETALMLGVRCQTLSRWRRKTLERWEKNPEERGNTFDGPPWVYLSARTVVYPTRGVLDFLARDDRED